MKKTYLLLIWGILFACTSHKAPSAQTRSPNEKADLLLAQTPPMGWNSYNCFGGNVTEAEVKANADYMAEKLKPFGWEYVVVDFFMVLRRSAANDKEKPVKYIAVFNVLDMASEVAINPEEIGINEKSVLRDLWKRTDLGTIGKNLTIHIPAHGALLYSAN